MTVYCSCKGGVFERFLWIKAFVTLLMVWCSCLSIWRIYSTAVKPLFHLSLGFRAPDRNNSLSGKNCFISAFVCLSWKMKNPLLMYGMKTWWKPMCQPFSLFGWCCFFVPNFLVRHFQGPVPYSSFYALRSVPLTLDKMAVLINHRFSQEAENPTALTTLSQHLFTSHWFGNSHRSPASCSPGPTRRCWALLLLCKTTTLFPPS